MNFTFIYRKYKGKWVALTSDEKEVVGSGKTLIQAVQEAKENGVEEPFMFKVPATMIPYVASSYEVSL